MLFENIDERKKRCRNWYLKNKEHCKEYRLSHKKEINERAKKYWLENKDKIKEKSRKFYLENKDKIQERCFKNKDKKREYDKEYNTKNKYRIQIRSKLYRLKNKDKKREYHKEYYLKNKKKINKQNKKWALENPDKKKNHYLNNKNYYKEYQREYCLKNRDTINKKSRVYFRRKFREDANFRLSNMLRNSIYKKLKLYSVKKSEKTVDLLGCSIEKFRRYMETKFKKGMTWKNHSFTGWHIDHKIPLSFFNLTDYSERKFAFHYTNLQPLWSEENLNKGKKIWG